MKQKKTKNCLKEDGIWNVDDPCCLADSKKMRVWHYKSKKKVLDKADNESQKCQRRIEREKMTKTVLVLPSKKLSRRRRRFFLDNYSATPIDEDFSHTNSRTRTTNNLGPAYRLRKVLATNKDYFSLAGLEPASQVR